MNREKKEKTLKVLDMIAKDQKDDATNFDGQPFTGKTVAEYLANQGAAIAALANIVREFIDGNISEEEK